MELNTPPSRLTVPANRLSDTCVRNVFRLCLLYTSCCHESELYSCLQAMNVLMFPVEYKLQTRKENRLICLESLLPMIASSTHLCFLYRQSHNLLQHTDRRFHISNILNQHTPVSYTHLEMGGKKINWANAPVKGFAQKKTIYKDGENPFTCLLYTSRCV